MPPEEGLVECGALWRQGFGPSRRGRKTPEQWTRSQGRLGLVSQDELRNGFDEGQPCAYQREACRREVGNHDRAAEHLGGIGPPHAERIEVSWTIPLLAPGASFGMASRLSATLTELP